jgi:hypothetical protein
MAAAGDQLKSFARNPGIRTHMFAMNAIGAATNRESYKSRTGIAASVAGALMLGTAVVLEAKGHGVFGHVAEHKPHTVSNELSNAIVPAPKLNGDHIDAASAAKATLDKAKHADKVIAAKQHVSHSVHNAAAHHGHTVTMYHNPWETAQREMGLGHVRHLTPHQQHAIWDQTEHILRLNHLSEDDARHLAKGTELKV